MVKEISPMELKTLLEEGADLIDVREEEEMGEGSIVGGKHWPLSTFGGRRKDLSAVRPTIFYCRSGVLSIKAAEIADHWTEQAVYSLQGGLLGYLKEKQSVKQ